MYNPALYNPVPDIAQVVISIAFLVWIAFEIKWSERSRNAKDNN